MWQYIYMDEVTLEENKRNLFQSWMFKAFERLSNMELVCVLVWASSLLTKTQLFLAWFYTEIVIIIGTGGSHLS